MDIGKWDEKYTFIDTHRDEIHLENYDLKKILNWIKEHKPEIYQDNEDIKLAKILIDVQFELKNAQLNYGIFHNEHEGYAIILEELDELWDGVKLKQNNPIRKQICRKEAIQVCAMAIRFLYDLME